MVKMHAPARNETVWQPLEKGVYRAILKDVECVTSKNPFATEENGEPETREQFQYQWAIDNGDDEMHMHTLRSWTTQSVHERSNTAKVLRALAIDLPEPDEDYDTDDWLGHECQVQIDSYTRADGTAANKIVNYMAMPKSRRQLKANEIPF